MSRRPASGGNCATALVCLVELVVGTLLYAVFALGLALKWAYQALRQWRRRKHDNLRLDAAIVDLRKKGGSVL